MYREQVAFYPIYDQRNSTKNDTQREEKVMYVKTLYHAVRDKTRLGVFCSLYRTDPPQKEENHQKEEN